MDTIFLRLICCPKCKHSLTITKTLLTCNGCKKKYRIIKDIPVLLDLDNLPPHLQGQIKYFENEKRSSEYHLDEWQRSYIRRLTENFDLSKNKLLIDVGTGSGYIAVEMAKRGLNVIACDLTLKSLMKLKSAIREYHLENNLFLVCCNAEELPIKDETGDYLVSNAILEHLPKEMEAIKEISRVSKKSSDLMITVPILLRYVFPLFWLPTYIHDKSIGHLRKYDEKIIFEKFKKYGYEINKTYYPGHIEKEIVVTLATLGVKSDKWDRWAEIEDKKKESSKYGASNICVILHRGY